MPLAWPSQCAFHRLPAGPSLVVLPCVRAMQPSMPGNLTWAMQDTLSLRTSAKREVPLHALWPVRPVWPSAIRLGVVWWGRRTSLRSMSCAAGGKVCREWQQALDFPSRAFRPHDSACPHCTRRRGDLQEGQEVRPEGPIHTRYTPEPRCMHLSLYTPFYMPAGFLHTAHRSPALVPPAHRMPLVHPSSWQGSRAKAL